jgi:hypothetical protein
MKRNCDTKKQVFVYFYDVQRYVQAGYFVSTRQQAKTNKGKSKGLPQQAEVAQGVPCRLRSRIFLPFGTKRVVGRQPYSPAAFIPGEIPGTHFQDLSRQPRKKIPSDTTGNRPRDRQTSSAVPKPLRYPKQTQVQILH